MGRIMISPDCDVKVGIPSDQVDLLHEVPIPLPIQKASQCRLLDRRRNSVLSSQGGHQNTLMGSHLLHPLLSLQPPCPPVTLRLDHHSPSHPLMLRFRQSTQILALGCRAPVRKLRKCSLAQSDHGWMAPNSNSHRDPHDHHSHLHLLLPKPDRLRRKHKDKMEELDPIPTHPNFLVKAVNPVTRDQTRHLSVVD